MNEAEDQAKEPNDEAFNYAEYAADLAEVELVAKQHDDLQRQVDTLRMVIKNEFAGLNPDVAQAKLQLAQLRDQVVENEELLKRIWV